jgi:hypothetical protein
MRTLEIPIKFEKGDTIYTTKQVKLENVCPICEGKGTIKYNDKDMKCPECMGKGKFISNKVTNIVCDEPYVITSLKISVRGDNSISVKYRGNCGLSTLNRPEENLFLTKEEAQIRCDELNKERIWINVKDIAIQDEFKKAPPSIDKISSKLDYYRKNKKFDSNIIINKKNILQDGYITYLLYKLLNIDTVKAIVEN